MYTSITWTQTGVSKFSFRHTWEQLSQIQLGLGLGLGLGLEL